MDFILQPWQLYVVILAGWINRQQHIAIACGQNIRPNCNSPTCRTLWLFANPDLSRLTVAVMLWMLSLSFADRHPVSP